MPDALEPAAVFARRRKLLEAIAFEQELEAQRAGELAEMARDLEKESDKHQEQFDTLDDAYNAVYQTLTLEQQNIIDQEEIKKENTEATG